jgi:hypothetical protein
MGDGPSRRHGSLDLRAVGREALSAYRAHAGVLLLTAALVFIPLGLVEAALNPLDDLDAEDASGGAIAGLVGAALLVAFTATLGDVFYTGVVAGIVAEHRTGARRELANIARTLPYGRLVAVDVLFALLVGVGVIALIVPGVIAFTWFVLAAPVVEIEGRGVRHAFGRSRALVRGNFWPVLSLLAPVVIVGDALGNLMLSGGPWLLGDGFFGDWLGAVLAQALTVPLFALPAVVTTHHLISGGRPASPRTPPR